MSLPPPFSTRETHRDIEVQTKETATRTLSQTKNDVFLDSETKLHHVNASGKPNSGLITLRSRSMVSLTHGE